MGTKTRETPSRRRWQDRLESPIRTLAIVALFLIAIRFVWVHFVRGSTLFRVVNDAQELAPKAEQRNQDLRELTGPSAGKQDK